MSYGKIKANAVVYDAGEGDVEVNFNTLHFNTDKANRNNADLTGIPTAPTAPQGTNTQQIATTAFVNTEIAPVISTKADLQSPEFTGEPTAPTVSQGDSTTKIATTNFVNNEIQLDVPPLIAGKADVENPAFTGEPTAPTPVVSDNSARIATTAFVNSEFTSLLNNAVGVTVQGYDVDTVKNDESNIFTQLQSFDGGVLLDGAYKQVIGAVPDFEIDLEAGNYFSKTVVSDAAFTFENAPPSGTVCSFIVEITLTAGSVAWPDTVKFDNDTAPVLEADRTHLFYFVTDDGGNRYRAAALVDYVN